MASEERTVRLTSRMDPFLWRNRSHGVLILGAALVLAGTFGAWFFGNRSEEAAPFRRPIRSASSTVDIVVASPDDVNTTYADRGGLLAFGRGTEAIMMTTATESIAQQLGDDRVLWRGVFRMDANAPVAGQPVARLRDADHVLIEFLMMPKDAHVVEGRATVTVNSAVRLEVQVPEQTIQEGKILVRDLTGVFGEFR